MIFTKQFNFSNLFDAFALKIEYSTNQELEAAYKSSFFNDHCHTEIFTQSLLYHCITRPKDIEPLFALLKRICQDQNVEALEELINNIQFFNDEQQVASYCFTHNFSDKIREKLLSHINSEQNTEQFSTSSTDRKTAVKRCLNDEFAKINIPYKKLKPSKEEIQLNALFDLIHTTHQSIFFKNPSSYYECLAFIILHEYEKHEKIGLENAKQFINLTNHNGDNLLHLNWRHAPKKFIVFLTNLGVNLSHRNNQQLTPLDQAFQDGRQDVVNILLRLKGNPPHTKLPAEQKRNVCIIEEEKQVNQDSENQDEVLLSYSEQYHNNFGNEIAQSAIKEFVSFINPIIESEIELETFRSLISHELKILQSKPDEDELLIALYENKIIANYADMFHLCFQESNFLPIDYLFLLLKIFYKLSPKGCDLYDGTYESLSSALIEYAFSYEFFTEKDLISTYTTLKDNGIFVDMNIGCLKQALDINFYQMAEIVIDQCPDLKNAQEKGNNALHIICFQLAAKRMASKTGALLALLHKAAGKGGVHLLEQTNEHGLTPDQVAPINKKPLGRKTLYKLIFLKGVNFSTLFEPYKDNISPSSSSANSEEQLQTYTNLLHRFFQPANTENISENSEKSILSSKSSATTSLQSMP